MKNARSPALLFLSTLLAFSPAAAAQSYRFVVLADSRSDCQGAAKVNTAALGKLFDKIVELDPDFVFFSGDLACGRTDKESVKREFRVWEQTIASSGYDPQRVYPVFGGHERVGSSTGGDLARTWSAFREYFDPVAQQTLSCTYYDPAFGPPGDRTDFSHTVYYCDFADRDRFFVLNNDCIPKSHSVAGGNADRHGCVGHEIGCAQFNWVRNNLVRNGHNFIFQHEPAFGTGAHSTACPSTPRFVMDNKKPQRNDWARLLGHYNATAIFSGHEHQYTRRFIEPGLLDTRLNTDGVRTSLAILISSESANESAEPAIASSFDSGRKKAPKLKLWWTRSGGKPDWVGRVRSGADDAAELEAGEVNVFGKKLTLQSRVALRWTNVPIPEGAKIKKARIELTAGKKFDGGQTVRIHGEASPFAFPFSRCAADLTLRPQTRSSKTWTIGRWRKGKRYLSKNLAGIVQELVDEHHVGDRFPVGFQEVKTGSAGAPWKTNACGQFMNGILAKVITQTDAQNHGAAWPPYHFAVVDVNGNRVKIDVYALKPNGRDLALLDSTR